jgi:hypothetical protein
MRGRTNPPDVVSIEEVTRLRDHRWSALPCLISHLPVKTLTVSIGYTYLVHHNPKHEWFYASEMMSDEVILIKVNHYRQCLSRRRLTGSALIASFHVL